MARIELAGVAHRYDEDWALHELSHVFEDGVAVAVLGPSGCGKTTLLSILSGLLEPTKGTIRIDERDVTRESPRQRKVAQVFQFPVVYESMTTYDNLAFPLRNAGLPEAEIEPRVAEVSELLDLAECWNQPASQLGADLKQLVSLGRGLVRPDVAALLLDEPLTVIDPTRRWEIRQKLRRVHRTAKPTLLYVTHDQTEALTFADEIIVMDEGRVLQVGSPQELFENPRHRFVGRFIGSPGMNFLPCEIEDGAAHVEGFRLPVTPSAGAGPFEVGVRPEYLSLLSSPAENAAPVRIDSVAELGDHRIVSAFLGEHSLKVRVPDTATLPSEEAFLRFPEDRTLLFQDGERVT